MKHTNNEAHDSTNSCIADVVLAYASLHVQSSTRIVLYHVLEPIMAPIFTKNTLAS